MKRILSLVLVLAMCFCTMAVPAFAAGVTENTARMITDLDEYTTVDEYEGYLKLYPNNSFDISIQVETPASAEIYTYQVDLTYDPTLFTCTSIGEGTEISNGLIRYIELLGGGTNIKDAITYTFAPVNNDITTTQYYENAFTLNGVVLNEAKDSISGEDKSVAESTISIALVKQFTYDFNFTNEAGTTDAADGTIDEFEKYDFTWFSETAHKDYSWQIDGDTEARDTDYMKSLTATKDIVATVTETNTKYAVTLPDDGSLDGNAQEATYYDDYVGTIPSDEYNDLFDYQVQYQPADGSGTWEDAVMDEDEFTIPAGSIEGNIELQIGSKTLKDGISVNVTEFVDGDNAAIMLVEVTGLEQCNFDGNAMIKSTDYNSLVYLTQDARIANASDLEAATAVAIELLTSTTTPADAITRSGANGYDVNCDYVTGGAEDIYDASAAFAAAKQDYTLDATTVKLYLRADVNGDKKVDVTDYSAIKAYLLTANN